MKFYLVCAVPRFSFRVTALGDGADVADACFAYETVVGKEIYIIKKICVGSDRTWTPGVSLQGMFSDRPSWGEIFSKTSFYGINYKY